MLVGSTTRLLRVRRRPEGPLLRVLRLVAVKLSRSRCQLGARDASMAALSPLTLECAEPHRCRMQIVPRAPARLVGLVLAVLLASVACRGRAATGADRAAPNDNRAAAGTLAPAC